MKVKHRMDCIALYKYRFVNLLGAAREKDGEFRRTGGHHHHEHESRYIVPLPAPLHTPSLLCLVSPIQPAATAVVRPGERFMTQLDALTDGEVAARGRKEEGKGRSLLEAGVSQFSKCSTLV